MKTAFFIEMIRMESGQAVGSADQLARVQARLESLGKRVIVTREPGGSACGETIRARLKDEGGEGLALIEKALLFSAARIDHLDERIGPALREGVHVLSDRLVETTSTYQTLCGAVDQSLGNALERVVSNGIRPDLTLLLDRQSHHLTVDPVQSPLETDGGESIGMELREALLELAKVEPSRYAVVSATGSPEEIADAVWDRIRTRLPKLVEPTPWSSDVA